MTHDVNYLLCALTPLIQGTWQFLSVALLSRLKEVEICDELESFFYVILYYAVRYLYSNIDEELVGEWIHNFFDTFGFAGETSGYVCGQVKLNAIKTGELIVSEDETLKFNSPMDGLIADLLNMFKAHHAVVVHLRKRAKLKTLKEVAPGRSSSSSLAPLRSLRDSQSVRSEMLQKVKSRLRSEDKTAPSQAQWDLHELALTHEAMIQILAEAIQPAGPTWSDDKHRDLVPEDYRPPPQKFGPTLPETMACIKKAKLESEQAFSLPNYLPSQNPETPHRNRRVPPTTEYPKSRRR